MSPLQKLSMVLFCILFSLSLNAQSALQKAESYAKLDAPFLSIKYLQKHIRKQKEDRSAMRLLANTYLQVNMVTQGQKWLLKANNSPTVFSYFQKRNAIKAEQNKMLLRSDKEILPIIEQAITIKEETPKMVIDDQLLFLAVIGTMGSFI